MTEEKKEETPKKGYLVGDLSELEASHTVNLPAQCPPIVKEIIGLKSLGISNEAIGAQLGIRESGVRYHLKRWGLTKERFESAADARKRFAKAMFERVGLELMSRIKKEEVENLAIGVRIRYAELCFKAAESIKVRDRKRVAGASEKELAKQLTEGE